MNKALIVMVVFMLLKLFGCTNSNYNAIISDSSTLRHALLDYYAKNGNFPETLNEIKSELPNGVQIGGSGWNNWIYFSDSVSYIIYTYPSKYNRTRLIYKKYPDSPNKSGWFIDREDGTGGKPIGDI